MCLGQGHTLIILAAMIRIMSVSLKSFQRIGHGFQAPDYHLLTAPVLCFSFRRAKGVVVLRFKGDKVSGGLCKQGHACQCENGHHFFLPGRNQGWTLSPQAISCGLKLIWVPRTRVQRPSHYGYSPQTLKLPYAPNGEWPFIKGGPHLEPRWTFLNMWFTSKHLLLQEAMWLAGLPRRLLGSRLAGQAGLGELPASSSDPAFSGQEEALFRGWVICFLLLTPSLSHI